MSLLKNSAYNSLMTTSFAPHMVADVCRVWLAVPRVQGRLKLGLMAVAGGVCVFQAGMFAWGLVQPTMKLHTSLIAPSQADMAQVSPVLVEDYALLKNSSWFGVSNRLEESDIAQENVTVETTLNLELKGTIVGEHGRAIIRDNAKGTTHVLKEGENLFNGVTVARITRRRIVLDNNGNMEGLSLEGGSFMVDTAHNAVMPAMGKTSMRAPAPSVAPKRTPSKSYARYVDPQPDYVKLFDRKVTKRQKVALEKREVLDALSDLGTLGKQARFVPRVKNGDVEGFVLMNLQHDSFLSRLSLREGDILVKLDDVRVSKKGKLFPMLLGLAHAKEAELVINRRGTQIALQIDFGA